MGEVVHSMSREELAAAFNTWMRLYTDHPDQFSQGWEVACEYLKEVKSGKVPTYGDKAAAFLLACAGGGK